MSSTKHKITFPGAQGVRLAARFDLPVGAPRATALFAHCFTCSKDSLAAARISRALAAQGIAVLRFDFTGLGSSEGDFSNTNFSSNVDDLVAAANYLRENHQAPSLLVGHSLGGAAVLAAAGSIPELKAVATINAPADPSHVRQLLDGAEEQLAQTGEARVCLAGREFSIKSQFLDDIGRVRLSERIAKLGRPLLVFHAPRDETVGVDNASAIFAAAKHPKSFVSLDNADHLITSANDALYVADVLAAWAQRYLPAAAERSTTEGEVLVEPEGAGQFTQRVVLGPHTILSDEPESLGGNAHGPTPYDLLLAALGSCTNMTLRMYANHKKIPLERVSVRLTHQKMHAADCDSCEASQGKLDRIDREITLEGSLDDATRARLLEIADRCPVHRTLHSEIWVRTTSAAARE